MAILLVLLAACGRPSLAAGPSPNGPAATSPSPTSPSPTSRSATSPAATSADPLAGHSFRSTGVTRHGVPRPLVAGTRVELRFDADGRMAASAGCNTYNGWATVAGGRLRVRPLYGTRMGCSAAGTAQDAWLHGFLSSGPSWRLIDQTLVLTWQNSQIRLAKTGLFGVRWVVDELYTGQTIAPVPGGAVAHLTFDGTGGVSGSGGCNAFGGMASVSGHTIVFSQIIRTMMACGGGRDELERAVHAVLNAPRVNYALAGEHLTLTTPHHNGLRLTAR